ncbi:MAG: ImmA/IrrE family metallo-endopeptidase [Bacteroidota bacterium]|nr:ImmA/IrrE family metallo-endopeptidase [Bacteroidota bacterium]
MKIEGLKHLSRLDIEDKTIKLLQYYNSSYFQFARSTPLLKIVAFLQEKHDIFFDFKATLGFSENGYRILGAFNPAKRVVLIDSSLSDDECKFNFTLGHELGHLALHRNVKIYYTDEKDPEELNETINEELGGKNRLTCDAQWIEWQANYYASSLLMPQDILKTALVQVQKDIGIRCSGNIYVDEQPCNKTDYYSIIGQLSTFFKVSKSALEFRLMKLDLINDNRKKILRIGQILDLPK